MKNNRGFILSQTLLLIWAVLIVAAGVAFGMRQLLLYSEKQSDLSCHAAILQAEAERLKYEYTEIGLPGLTVKEKVMNDRIYRIRIERKDMEQDVRLWEFTIFVDSAANSTQVVLWLPHAGE